VARTDDPIVTHQPFVVAGWTEPRGSRPFFGALILGAYDDRGALQYVGQTGAGFTDAELGRVWKQLHALEVKTPPFAIVPRTNKPPHWVKPKLVAEVQFKGWTADGTLRHATYMGLRDDVKQLAPALVRERSLAADREPRQKLTSAAIRKLLDQLDSIQDAGGDGVLQLPGGDRLEVSNLGKVFWPPRPRSGQAPRLGSGQASALTKGDLLRHYVRVAPYILAVLADRPLVMKRYPNGVTAKPFYQHRAPDKLPPGVRVEMVRSDNETRPHLIGGSLVTLLYTAQLASISQDPWFSRVGSERMIDHVAIDLDPPEGLPFSKVLDVARWVHEELDTLKAPGFAKTSGSDGLHVYVPMPPDTPYHAGLLFCQIVATMVAKKHPKAATVERSIKARGQRVYVDYLQNILGKTLASAYSPRANEFAGVSTPVTWDEIDEGISPRDFTIANFAERIAAAGDLWAALRKSRPADLNAVMQYAEP
jgi:bifunctional non-homologous end joining protein LigD